MWQYDDMDREYYNTMGHADGSIPDNNRDSSTNEEEEKIIFL
jgi:hypothetical protein